MTPRARLSSLVAGIALVIGATGAVTCQNSAAADPPPRASQQEAYEDLSALEQRLNEVLVEGQPVKTSREVTLEARVKELEGQLQECKQQLDATATPKEE